MTRLCIFSLLVVATCTLPREEVPLPAEKPPELPNVFRRNGLISSSTYQVSVVLKAKSREEAKLSGEAQAKERAFFLIMQEPFIRKYLSPKSRDDVLSLVESSGRVVRVFPEKDGSWSVVFQVNRIGLRSDLERLR